MKIFCSFVTDLAAVKARMAVTYKGHNKTARKTNQSQSRTRRRLLLQKPKGDKRQTTKNNNQQPTGGVVDLLLVVSPWSGYTPCHTNTAQLT
jgi:hypothetical protein